METLPMDTAEELLAWASLQNPGPWADHSRVVAKAAAVIAFHCGMHSQQACALGLIHDIGRYKGNHTDIIHILDGHHFMMKHGYAQAAQIYIMHSFPSQILEEYSGNPDCNPTDRNAILNVLTNAVYTDYDRLIQLCDSLALPDGICLMEKRLVDVALRHGVNDWMISKWKKYLQLFQYFQSRTNKPLYSLFPEVVENTFNAKP